ncbi:DUF3997 domain-containing protein [Cruoricaptor ignavus]|uniref:DUF3997 domain-containing protein n=1 Tax=Cruoricaptor ignavus TaxID=1118202 RepID=UPI00370DBF66
MHYRILSIIILIIFSSCGNEPLEKNYELDYNPTEEINLVTPTENGYQRIEIPGHILFYGHNKDFIIAQQKSADSIYNEDENLDFNRAQKKIFNTRFSNFWIITLKNDSIYGPLSKSQYFHLRDSLKVPRNLNLNYSTQTLYTDGKREDIEYYSPDSNVVDIKNLIGNVEKHHMKRKE